MPRITRCVLSLAILLAFPLAGAGRLGQLADEGARAPDAPPITAAVPAISDPPSEPGEPETERRRAGDKVAIGTSMTVEASETIVGSVVCIGCSGRMDGRVLGDIVVIAGSLEIGGSGTGELVAVASTVELGPEARIDGDVVNVGGRVRREDRQVGGQVVDLGTPGMMLGAFGGVAGIGGALGLLDGLFGLWFTLLTWVLLVLVLILLAALVPDRIRRIAEEVPVVPVAAFLWGLLAYILLPFAVLLMIFSCIGIPLFPFAYFAFKVFKWLGMAGIFLYVGRRLGLWFHREIPLLGAILLGMAPFLLLRLLPFCVGWLAWFVLEILAIGYVIATRAGRPMPSQGLPTRPAPADEPQGTAAP